jgi:hypothetical protein
MKKFFVLLLSLVSLKSFAQNNPKSAVGSYESTFEYGLSGETDVKVIQDPKNKNKVWIEGIVEGRIYAVVALRGVPSIIYNIPDQVVNGKKITKGQLIFRFEEQEVFITNDNSMSHMSISTNSSGTSIKNKNGETVVGADANGNVDVNGGGSTVKTNGKGELKIDVNTELTPVYFYFKGNKVGFKPADN